MGKEQFEALVKKLEEYSTRDDAGYRKRVAMLAALGYGYVWLVLALVVGLLLLLVWGVMSMHTLNVIVIKIGFALVILAFMIVRSLWVTFPRPQGIFLSREQVPQLFAMIDELTTALQAPRFHYVLLDAEFNAAVLQRPKLGIFGWQENYLVLGLPLMQALSPEQFRAVVAHELGHLSGNHSRFAGWIYRVAATWEQLEQNFAQSGHGGGILFERFVRWYWPFFNAYSFVLRRADEYVADRCAAQLAGAETAQQALINVEVKGQFLSAKFWPAIYKRAEHEAEPPAQAFSQLGRAFREELAPEDAKTWIARSLRAESDYTDTHPSLSQRLKSLGYQPGAEISETVVATAMETAAQRFLGPAQDDLTRQLETLWHDGVAPAWKERHEYARQSMATLNELDDRVTAAEAQGQAVGEALTKEEMWNRARWTAEFRNNPDGIALLRGLLEVHPDYVEANFGLGQLLLEEDDDSGIAVLEKAMQLEPATTLDACFLIHNFLKEHDRDEEAKGYYERATGHFEVLSLAQIERANIGPGDTFLAPELPAEELEAVRAALRQQDRVGEAWLVRKQVQHMPEQPCYILGIATRQTMAKFLSTEDNAKLIEALSEMAEKTSISVMFVEDENSKALLKAMRKVEGAKIYSFKEAA